MDDFETRKWQSEQRFEAWESHRANCKVCRRYGLEGGEGEAFQPCDEGDKLYFAWWDYEP